jgi:hypothetical protein
MIKALTKSDDNYVALRAEQNSCPPPAIPHLGPLFFFCCCLRSVSLLYYPPLLHDHL